MNRYPKTSQWTHLPLEVRQHKVRLLVQLLRQHRHGLYAAAHQQVVAMSDKIGAHESCPV